MVMIVGSPPLWSLFFDECRDEEMLCAQLLPFLTSQGPRMGALTQMMPTKVSRMAQMVETSTSLA